MEQAKAVIIKLKDEKDQAKLKETETKKALETLEAEVINIKVSYCHTHLLYELMPLMVTCH